VTGWVCPMRYLRRASRADPRPDPDPRKYANIMIFRIPWLALFCSTCQSLWWKLPSRRLLVELDDSPSLT